MGLLFDQTYLVFKGFFYCFVVALGIFSQYELQKICLKVIFSLPSNKNQRFVFSICFKMMLLCFLTDKPGPVTYVPPDPSEKEEEMFRSIERGINFDKYDEIPVEVTGKGKETITPIQSFQEANLRESLLLNVQKAKYTKPTPVQKYAIPTILAGRDVMACAQTGSGKTVNMIL